MTSDAAERIGALRRSHDDLVTFVDAVGEGALGTPSGAAEWTVAQVLSHLGSGAEIARNTLRASIEGKPAPGSEQMAPIWDRWNAMTPTEMAEGFRQADEQLVTEFEGLDVDTIENLRVDLGFLPEPIDVAMTATFRLNEHALHSWDVHAGFDPRAVLAPYVAPLLADQMARMVGFTGAPLGRGSPVVIETTAPAGRYILELADAVTLRSGAGAAADAGTTLRLPLEALLRLAAGRLKLRNTPASVSIEGELSLDDLRTVFPGY